MSSRILLLVAAAVALLILWRLSQRVPPAISFTEEAMVFRSGKCVEAIPMKRMRHATLQADAVTVERTFATLYNGDTVVDEKISLPADYTFGKAPNAIVAQLFDLKKLHAAAASDRMILFEGERPGTGVFRVLAIVKGKKDLELLYPINASFARVVVGCLIEGKKPDGPIVINRIVTEGSPSVPPLANWDEKLFTLGMIVNKDM